MAQHALLAATNVIGLPWLRLLARVCNVVPQSRTVQLIVEIPSGALDALRMFIMLASAATPGLTLFSLLPSPTAGLSSRLARRAWSSSRTQMEASLLSKTLCPVSWAPLVFTPVGSITSADLSLRSALEGQAELLCYELLDMAPFLLEEMVQPICNVVDSIQG